MSESRMADAGGRHAREVAEILLRVEAVSINAEKPFVYTSGIVSPTYCDLRLLLSYPAERARVVGYMADAMTAAGEGGTIDVVAGVAVAGIPFAAWAAERLGKPMVFVRETAKAHGKQQRIEGKVEPGQRAVVVEDLISTGGSAVATADALRGADVRVVHCLSIFSYEFPVAAQRFSEAGLTLWSLSTVSVLLETAIEGGAITRADGAAVRQWLQAYGQDSAPG